MFPSQKPTVRPDEDCRATADQPTNQQQQVSPTWKDKERKGKERKGKERKGKERKGKERKGKERKGKERKGKERKGKERKGKERKGKERKGKERKGWREKMCVCVSTITFCLLQPLHFFHTWLRDTTRPSQDTTRQQQGHERGERHSCVYYKQHKDKAFARQR